MNKAVIATLSFAAGAGFGFAVGYYMINKKTKTQEEEYVEPIYLEPEKKSEETHKPEPEKTPGGEFVSKPAQIAMPGKPGINYTEFVKDLKYKQETQSPSEDDTYDTGEGDGETEEGGEELDMSKYEETFEERVARESEEVRVKAEEYKKAHKGKIELMQSDEWDTDFPETDYEREDLYYFTDSDILTDEDGHQLNELEFIGPKVRQVGWMQSSDENIYVRNHPKQKEYRVFKEHCSVEDWF